MDSCRWASYIGEAPSKVDKDLVALPQTEQAARGRELLQLLTKQQQPQQSSMSSEAPSEKRLDSISARTGGIDWNVMVRQTFIDVKIPASKGNRRRTVSDSALPCFDKAEKPWKSIVGELDDISDASTASTDDSADRVDFDANLGANLYQDDYQMDATAVGEAEAVYQAPMPYQYADSWWIPVSYDTSTQAGYSFMPMQWVSHGVDTMDRQTTDCQTEGTGATAQEWKTTVMIRNMPNNYTRDMLLELVDSMGFAGTYDFAYLPIDFQSQAGLGYAFINFSSVTEALRCFNVFEGFTGWVVPSEKVCTVTWSTPTQGLDEHIDRYRNSPVMHHSLPDEWKPILLQQGMRIAFPPPTKSIKTPKVRQHPSGKNGQY